MYKKIVQYIEKNIKSEATAEDLASLLSDFKTKFSLSDLIKDILQDDLLCKQIASRSYFHYNGFDKIIIHESVMCKLRLHIWWASNVEYKENIHDHRWNFASWIVKGEYINEIYREDKDWGELYREYYYKPKKEKQNYALEFVGLTQLRKESIEKLEEGKISLCNIGNLHKVTPLMGINTVTLFLQSSSILPFARVLNTENIIDSDNIQAISMKADYLSNQLNKLITIL